MLDREPSQLVIRNPSCSGTKQPSVTRTQKRARGEISLTTILNEEGKEKVKGDQVTVRLKTTA